MKHRKRYTIIGTGSRAGMYVKAITTTYTDVAELVAFCDYSQIRMNWYNQQLVTMAGVEPIPTYYPEQFDQMIAEQKPDTVIVTTIDSTHHLYITRAMALGCDVRIASLAGVKCLARNNTTQ